MLKSLLFLLDPSFCFPRRFGVSAHSPLWLPISSSPSNNLTHHPLKINGFLFMHKNYTQPTTDSKKFIWAQVKYIDKSLSLFANRPPLTVPEPKLLPPCWVCLEGSIGIFPFETDSDVKTKLLKKSKSMSPLVIGVLLSFSCQKINKEENKIISTP